MQQQPHNSRTVSTLASGGTELRLIISRIMQLDMRTIIFMDMALMGLMSGVLFAIYRSYPASVRGIAAWAQGTLLYALSGVFFGSRGVMSDWLSVVLANFLYFSALVLWWRGTCQLFGRPERMPPLIVALVASALMMAWWTFLDPNYGMRQAFAGLVFLIGYGALALLAWRHGERTFSIRAFIWVAAATALLGLMRLLTGLSVDRHASLFSAETSAIYAMGMTFTSLLLVISFFLLATHRLRVELERQARQDPLTGALNRRALSERAASELGRAHRHQRPCGLVAMDLDKFKAINDTGGHDLGDRVLQHFADLVRATHRDSDHFARLGGEEFVLLLPDTDQQGAVQMAERIRQALNGQASPDLPRYTCSFGVATLGDAADSFEAMVKRADEALYRAKTGGRDRVELA